MSRSVVRLRSARRRMLPPRPPSPPSGPPRGTYFSRRKLTQPSPPGPLRIVMKASSRNRAKSVRLGGGHAHPVPALELDLAADQREERVVAAHPDVETWPEARSALA